MTFNTSHGQERLKKEILLVLEAAGGLPVAEDQLRHATCESYTESLDFDSAIATLSIENKIRYVAYLGWSFGGRPE